MLSACPNTFKKKLMCFCHVCLGPVRPVRGHFAQRSAVATNHLQLRPVWRHIQTALHVTETYWNCFWLNNVWCSALYSWCFMKLFLSCQSFKFFRTVISWFSYTSPPLSKSNPVVWEVWSCLALRWYQLCEKELHSKVSAEGQKVTRPPKKLLRKSEEHGYDNDNNIICRSSGLVYPKPAQKLALLHLHWSLLYQDLWGCRKN